ncbi:MAG TPA: DUF4397 domain-containing protein [Streptosporangiaceae bacterium]|nr:DUF4397 domain-containing protein [Streptosporangiaceae bacterium]
MKLRAAMALAPLSLALALVGAAPSAAAQGTGWIRWGNWSPSAPNFDIYLNSFGGSSGPTVIRHVHYGHVSMYMSLPTGQYTIAMRDAGAAASSPPMLSASVQVTAGTAYTIVSMGPASHLGVQVLKETMMSAPGKALVRVVQESVQQHRVTVTDGDHKLGGPLLLGAYTGFMSVSPGWQAIHAAGISTNTSTRVFLPADTIHTLVVLDKAEKQGGLRIHSLQDAVGSKTMPAGGAATGFGGTAPRPGPSPLLWLAVIAGGGLLAAMGMLRMWRTRRRAAHAMTGR